MSHWLTPLAHQRDLPTQAARILIIDDDLILGEQLRSLIALLGHHASCCSEPNHAWELLASNHYDLIFCDYWLPDPAGHNFLQQTFRRMPELTPKFVLLTGGVLSDETQFFIRSAGNPQLLKPFKLQAVQAVLTSALSTHAPA